MTAFAALVGDAVGKLVRGAKPAYASPPLYRLRESVRHGYVLAPCQERVYPACVTALQPLSEPPPVWKQPTGWRSPRGCGYGWRLVPIRRR